MGLEELGAALATMPQVEQSIREPVEQVNTWKAQAERPDEVKGSATGSSLPEIVAAAFDDLHGHLEEWVLAIEGRIYNIEQLTRSAVSLVAAAKASSGNTPSASSLLETHRIDTPAPGAIVGEIGVQPPLEVWKAETPVLHCLCMAFFQLEGDVDKVRTFAHERSDKVRRMEARFRSEIKEIQSSIKELCDALQVWNMQVAVQECTQRLADVELDMMHVKDGIKAQTAALKVIQCDCRDKQTSLKVDGSQDKHHEVKLKASNHGATVETKDVHHPSGASGEGCPMA